MMNLYDLVKRFADGTGLTAREFADGRDAGVFNTHGISGTWALTEFGRGVLDSVIPPHSPVANALYYKNRQRNEMYVGKLIGTLREADPHGKDQHETGAKLDAGKPRLGLVLGAFANALVEVGKVGTYGAQKYTDNGWLDVPKGKGRYTDALLRHVLAETNETHDPDTHLLHAAHAAWNALARLELILRKREVNE